MGNKAGILFAVMIAVLASSCASLGDPFVLVFDVDDKYKAEAMTSTGVDAYKLDLIASGNVSASSKVQRYFEAALRYDPTNAVAARYLVLVEDFRASRYSSAMKTAGTLMAKPARSPDEEYALLLAIHKAEAIYPGDQEAVQLVKSTKEIKESYITARLADAEALRATVNAESKDADKERAYIDAFKIVLKVRDIEPAHVDGSKAYRELKKEISVIVETRLVGVDTSIAKKAFDEAKSVLAVIKDLDSRIGGTFKTEIGAAEYRLYFAWAKYHEERKEWTKSDARIRTAIALQKSSEALALQKRITAAANAEELGASFDAGLKNLDAYIAKGDLLRAQRVLTSLSKSATTSGQRQSLDTRRKKMLDSLAGIYAAGVKAYREEKFKEAVTLLEQVVAVEASYEEASDYLDKAVEKQKLLDQY